MLVAGCHIGDCHYLEGNVQAEKKIRMTRRLLEVAGIGSDRLHLYWCSSAEAQRFAEIAAEVTESIRGQGRFDPKAFRLALAAAEATLNGEILRWTVGKEVRITTEGDVYGRRWDADAFETIMDAVLAREYHIQLIFQAIAEGCRSPREIHARVDLDLQRVSYLLADMEKRSMVEFKEMRDHKPVFTVR